MKILFINPEYPDTYWSFRYVLSFISKKASFPPLGLLTVAAMLPKVWGKKLIDVNVEKLKSKHIKWADMIFISAMIVQRESAQEIINKCKKFGKKIVAGGPAFTTMHEKFSGVDHFVLNEAEITLPMFLNDYANGSLKKFYTSSKRPDILLTPPPDLTLIKMKKYVTMLIQCSRGCPYSCEFCDVIIMNGQTPRVKSCTQVINELQALYDAGWRGGVFIVDDNFIGNKRKIKEILRQIIEWQKNHDYPFKLYTEASVNLADDEELMNLMSQANFYKVFLGIETPSLAGLKECNKTQNIERDLKESVKIIHGRGMQVMAGFIVGFDSDPVNIAKLQIEFIQEIGVRTAMVGMLNVLPGTRLWRRLKSENRLLDDSTGENTDGSLNFLPKMGKDELIREWKKIISTIYSPKYYFERAWKGINDYEPTVKSKLTCTDIKAFLRSIVRIGIISNSRYYYWKLLFKTFIKKRRAFGEAVEAAINGQHFIKKTRRILKGK